MKTVDTIRDKKYIYHSEYDIGKVTINPIYSKFQLKKGNYKEVVVHTVYPNGHPSLDRLKARRVNAASQETQFKASENDILDSTELENIYEEDAKEGYVKFVKSRGKSIVESLIQTIFF